MSYKNSKKILTSAIPEVFIEKEGKIFPDGYVNNVKWWGNSDRKELHSLLPNGTAKLLMMDIDFGDICSLNCPHCFRRDSRFDDVKQNKLSSKEIISYIKEAKTLGLKQIKVLGRGEPFENKEFLGFLREMTKMDIGVSIFSKGHVLGSDYFAKLYNEEYGIKTAKQLVKEIKKLNVSILLGFNSFDKEMQDRFTGVDKYPESSEIKNYTYLRDQALINLTEAGFNKYKKNEATRLAMICSPIKPENINEVFSMYTWARTRNIYMLSCPTTISGKGLDEYEREKKFSSHTENLIKLYSKIYIWSIKSNLISLDTFKKDGVSLYPGCHVCNQSASGLSLNLSGLVNQCPGRVDKNTIFSKNIKNEKNLKSVWMNSINYKRAMNTDGFNYHCVARDGYSLNNDFYTQIDKNVKSRFKI